MLLVGHPGLAEGGHFPVDPDPGFQQGQPQGGAGAFPQAHLKLQQGFEAQEIQDGWWPGSTERWAAMR